MAATVVSVVIFLCGVLVGRGVGAERGAEGEVSELGAVTEPAPRALAGGSDPTASSAPSPGEDLSYFNRLEGSTPPVEQLRGELPSAPPSARGAGREPRAVTPPAREPEGVPTAVGSVPSGSGYVVQIAALNIRSEADAIANRLASKGYAAYVMSPSAGTLQIYRVRIGKFGSRREAETIAIKLEKEEQFKPWITR